VVAALHGCSSMLHDARCKAAPPVPRSYDILQVFLHGCARSARNFFPFDADLCPDCIGGWRLPWIRQDACRVLQ
jgi:hypothetical protein